jgi:anion-transporting  ArsA/GET3 family ATPase
VFLHPLMQDLLKRNLIFVCGKGGVGKTAVSQAIALGLAKKGKSTLWIEIENPLKKAGCTTQEGPNLTHYNCESQIAFEEYALLKLKIKTLTKIFLKSRLIQFLAKAAPGIHEIVLLGKIWHERLNYEHVVVDMPSTGFGIAMFQSTRNFANLFHGGPIQKDAQKMSETLGDPKQSGSLIVALPEEMPLQESLDLEKALKNLYPENSPFFLANKLFPDIFSGCSYIDFSRIEKKSLLARSSKDYAINRCIMEKENLALWEEVSFHTLDYVTPIEIVNGIYQQLLEKNFYEF